MSVFLQRLEEYQPSILIVHQAWEAIPTNTFGGHDDRHTFKHIAVKEGLFRTLVTFDSSASISSFLLKAGINPSVHRLRNHRQVLQAWASPFRQSREVPELVKDEHEDTVSEEERFAKRGKIDRRGVLKETVKRKSVIVGAMSRTRPLS